MLLQYNLTEAITVIEGNKLFSKYFDTVKQKHRIVPLFQQNFLQKPTYHYFTCRHVFHYKIQVTGAATEIGFGTTTD